MSRLATAEAPSAEVEAVEMEAAQAPTTKKLPSRGTKVRARKP